MRTIVPLTGGDTGLILLAAGMSSRMGEPKQLLQVGGRPMVRHAAQAALMSDCKPIVVVVGAYEEQVRQALAGLPVIIAVNPDWREGMGSSIQAGIRALPETCAGGAILALADQPLITARVYNDLLQRAEHTGKPVVASQYADTVGVPVLFRRTFFPNLMALEPSQGCKGIILGHPAESLLVDCPEAEVDIDNAADYHNLTAAAAYS
jgi:molybdenum cofactor cytidylyltransferase